MLWRASKPNRARPLVAVVATLMLMAVGTGLVWRASEAPTLSASVESKLAVTDEGVTLSSGRLSVATRKPMKLRTPQVEVAMTSCRMAAEVDVNGTELWVENGEVVARTPEGPVAMKAGDHRRFLTAPTLPESLRETAVPTPTSCDERAPSERLACLTQESEGAGLAAQLALNQRATLDHAHAEPVLRESLRRFPSGVMHPEVRLGLLRLLLEQGRYEAATRETLELERTCPDDSRVRDVRRIREQIQAQ